MGDLSKCAATCSRWGHERYCVNVPKGTCAGCGHGWATHGLGGCGVKNGHDVYCGCGLTPPSMVAEQREQVRQDMLASPCPDHPRYQIRRSPRVACEKCWRMYIAVHP